MDALVAHLKDQRLITDYVYVSAVAIMAYDYMLTFHLEIFLIWFSPWNYTKILFVLTRYIPVIECFLFVYNQMWPDISPTVCKYSWNGSTWLILFSMNIAEVVLCIRTWAIWKCDARVGFGLAALISSCLIAQCAAMALFGNSVVFDQPPFPGYRGCFIIGSSSLLVWNYFMMLIIEAVVLALMATSAIKAYRANDRNQLLHVVHRDGIMFYIYILCVSIANVLIITTSRHDLLGLLSPMEATIYSVLTSRIIFNVRRKMDNPSNTVELHTDYRDEAEYGEDSVALTTILFMSHSTFVL